VGLAGFIKKGPAIFFLSLPFPFVLLIP
jgi:hypothetical protein